jgi:hypothetical protein
LMTDDMHLQFVIVIFLYLGSEQLIKRLKCEHLFVGHEGCVSTPYSSDYWKCYACGNAPYFIILYCRMADNFKANLHYTSLSLKVSHATCLQLELYCVNQHTTHLRCRRQWRNYYGLRPGERGGPKPQWAKWGPLRLRL